MILSSALQAIGLFIATNIDDIIVLSLFFARGAGQRGTTARILAGQYLGFVGILGAAVLVSLGAGAFLPPGDEAQRRCSLVLNESAHSRGGFTVAVAESRWWPDGAFPLGRGDHAGGRNPRRG